MSQTIRISQHLARVIRLRNDNEDLVCRCVYLGYGPSAIASCVTGLTDDKDLVIEMSDGVGYTPGCIKLEVECE